MPTVEYEFKRDDNFPAICNGNRPSSDAMGVIKTWADPSKGRTHTLDMNEKLQVIATLTFDDTDDDAVKDLISSCNNVHIVCMKKTSQQDSMPGK